MSLIENFDGEGRMWVAGYPMSGATLLVILHCAGMLACTLAATVGSGGPIRFLEFNAAAIFAGQVWKLFTYAFVGAPSLNFAINMAVLYWIGLGVETSIGRPSFFKLYGALILFQGVFFALAERFTGVFASPGVGAVIFGVFIAYAAINPDVGIFFGIPAKYIAYVLLAVFALQALQAHDWVDLSFLGLNAGLSYGAMRLLGFQGGIPGWDDWIERWRSRAGPAAERPKTEDPDAAVNAILDKIASRGINSLTPEEREALERARSSIRKKDHL